MSDIAPEDRERLVKVKFRELFDEAFNESFDKRVVEMHDAKGNKSEASQPSGQPAPQRQTSAPRPERKRSLLEESLSQVLGLG